MDWYQRYWSVSVGCGAAVGYGLPSQSHHRIIASCLLSIRKDRKIYGHTHNFRWWFTNFRTYFIISRSDLSELDDKITLSTHKNNENGIEYFRDLHPIFSFVALFPHAKHTRSSWSWRTSRFIEPPKWRYKIENIPSNRMLCARPLSLRYLYHPSLQTYRLSY